MTHLGKSTHGIRVESSGLGDDERQDERPDQICDQNDGPQTQDVCQAGLYLSLQKWKHRRQRILREELLPAKDNDKKTGAVSKFCDQRTPFRVRKPGHQQPFGGNDPAARDDAIAVRPRDLCREQRVETVLPQARDGVFAADRDLEEQEPDDVAERRLGKAPVVDGDVRQIRRGPVVAEQRDDRLLVITRRAQRAAERRAGARVGNRIPDLCDGDRASCLHAASRFGGTGVSR